MDRWYQRLSLRMRAMLLALAMLLSMSAAVLPATTANAAVGRPNSAEAEIEAYYNEFLLRPSDPTGYAGYRDRMYGDCKFGILAAGMMIGDSREAHDKLRTPEAFVPALYRALLNRNADPGGYATYVNVIKARGYRWAISDIQSSGEFRNRLNAMCAGRRGIAEQNELKADEAVRAAIGINDAGMTLVTACGVGAVINLTSGLATKGLIEVTLAIRAAKLALGKAINNGMGGACISAYQVLTMADEIASHANYGTPSSGVGYNNPTYVMVHTTSSWHWNGRFCTTQMGGGESASTRSVRTVEYRC